MYIEDNDAGFDTINEYFEMDDDGEWIIPAKEDLPILSSMLGEPDEEPGSWRRFSFISLFDFLAFDIGYEIDELGAYLSKALKFADDDIKNLLKSQYDVSYRIQEIESFKQVIGRKYGRKIAPLTVEERLALARSMTEPQPYSQEYRDMMIKWNPVGGKAYLKAHDAILESIKQEKLEKGN